MNTTLALVGNPNSGKSTLFNELTNKEQYTGNWAGVTVELAYGSYAYKNITFTAVDLPGIYSLVATNDCSTDEKITLDFINSNQNILYINVIDAANLQKDLYLTLQLLETNKPIIVAVNFLEQLAAQGTKLDLLALAEKLKCPVVPISTIEKAGLHNLQELKAMIASYRAIGSHVPQYQDLPAGLSEIIYTQMSSLPGLTGLRIFEGDLLVNHQLAINSDQFASITQTAQSYFPHNLDIAIAQIRHHKIQEIVNTTTVVKSIAKKVKLTTRIDNIVLNKYLSLPIFFMVMYLMFGISINVGGYLQEYFDLYSSILFIQLPTQVLTSLNSPSWLITLIANGIGTGLNVTLTFIPVLAMMFLSMSLMENVGYMARAAFIVDKIMRVFGLPGKSFIPMIVGFGCNVPAIMSSRTIANYKERILTIMMIPFMSCSARLAIYAIFVAAFYPYRGHNIIFSLYLIGIIAAFLTGLLLRNSVLNNQEESLSIVEFPSYRIPSLKSIVKQITYRLKRFLSKAGLMIIPMCVGFGFVGTQRLSKIGQAVTPIFAPMGITQNNWPATVGLLSGLVAKETLIGTLNALYDNNTNLTLSNELSDNAKSAMLENFGSSQAAFAYLLFTLLYFPCISVVAAIAKELSLKWAMFSVIWSTSLAYCLATIYYQFACGHIKNGVLVSFILVMGLVIIKFKLFNKKAHNHKHKYLPTKVVLH